MSPKGTGGIPLGPRHRPGVLPGSVPPGGRSVDTGNIRFELVLRNDARSVASSDRRHAADMSQRQKPHRYMYMKEHRDVFVPHSSLRNDEPTSSPMGKRLRAAIREAPPWGAATLATHVANGEPPLGMSQRCPVQTTALPLPSPNVLHLGRVTRRVG